MKSTGKAWAFALAACVSVAGPAATLAGEAIAIGKPSTRVEPGKENKPENGLFGKTIGKTANTDPFQAVTPSVMPPVQPRNARQDKRLQNKADEKANFLLVPEGALTEDTDTFGVNDKAFSLDGLEKKDSSRDYTFYTLTKQKQDNGKANPELLRQIHKAKQNRELNASLDKSENSSGSLHTAGGLDFQKLLGPGKAEKNLLAPARTDLSMQGLFTAPPAAVDNKAAQERHTAKFNEFLNGSSPAAANNHGLDAFRNPGLEVKPASPALDFTPKAPANNPLFPAAAAGGGGLPAFGSPSADPNFGRANPFSPTPSPAPAYREPARNHAPPPQDFPRRSF